jgi:hypothetical protein
MTRKICAVFEFERSFGENEAIMKRLLDQPNGFRLAPLRLRGYRITLMLRTLAHQGTAIADFDPG